MALTGRACVFTGPGQPLQLREYAVPAPAGAEILVRVTACTMCGSDRHSFDGRREVATPTVLGHEILGRIAAFGPDAAMTDFRGAPMQVGDRVTWAVAASCGACVRCRRGLPQKCVTLFKYGHELLEEAGPWSGGLADYCLLIPGTAVFAVPESLTDAVACPASCATATVAAAIHAAGPIAERHALVIGAGLLGLTACAMLHHAGAASVTCCDTDAARLQRAAAFGATHCVAPAELAARANEIPGGFDTLIELSGSSDAWEAAFPLLNVGATAVLVGAVFPGRAVALPPEQIVRRQLTIRGVHNYTPLHLGTALEFLAATPELPWGELVGPWFGLGDAAAAFQAAADPACVRVGVKFGGDQ